MRSAELKKDKAIGIRLPLETFRKLKDRAEAQRRSVSNYVLLLIERDIEFNQPPLPMQDKEVEETIRSIDEQLEFLSGKITALSKSPREIAESLSRAKTAMNAQRALLQMEAPVESLKVAEDAEAYAAKEKHGG